MVCGRNDDGSMMRACVERLLLITVSPALCHLSSKYSLELEA